MRKLPLGLALLYLRGAIANYIERRGTAELFELKRIRRIAIRSVSAARKFSVVTIHFPHLKRALENEIGKSRQLIFDRRNM